jgi:hypothetical protein
VRKIAGLWFAERPRPFFERIRFDAIGVLVDAAGALVRLDHLDQVRLLPSPGRAAEPGGSGGPAESATAWFAAGGRRLARVRLTPLPSTAPAPSGAATLTLGSAVRVWPVPPGAPAPAIDPFLRRSPP